MAVLDAPCFHSQCGGEYQVRVDSESEPALDGASSLEGASVLLSAPTASHGRLPARSPGPRVCQLGDAGSDRRFRVKFPPGGAWDSARPVAAQPPPHDGGIAVAAFKFGGLPLSEAPGGPTTALPRG